MGVKMPTRVEVRIELDIIFCRPNNILQGFNSSGCKKANFIIRIMEANKMNYFSNLFW